MECSLVSGVVITEVDCMFHLCVCDAIVLLSIGIYTGSALLWPILQNREILNRIGCYVTATGWYGGTGFLVLLTLSRCVQLVWPHKTQKYFTRKRLLAYSCCFYVFPAVCFTHAFYYTPLAFTFFPSFFTWNYADDLFARILAWGNLGINGSCELLIIALNIKSLWWVHKTRTQIQGLEASANRKREINLFFQCMITGASYIVAATLFFIFTFAPTAENISQSIAGHLIWLSVHVQNPIIYFIANKRLRQWFIGYFRTG